MDEETRPVTRAKFKLNSIKRHLGGTYVDGKWVPGEVQTLSFGAVCDGSEENKRFFASSPSGSLELATVNPAVVAGFQLNGEYYIDITPAGA